LASASQNSTTPRRRSVHPAQLAVLVAPGVGAFDHPAATDLDGRCSPAGCDLAHHAPPGQDLPAGGPVVAGVQVHPGTLDRGRPRQGRPAAHRRGSWPARAATPGRCEVEFSDYPLGLLAGLLGRDLVIRRSDLVGEARRAPWSGIQHTSAFVATLTVMCSRKLCRDVLVSLSSAACCRTGPDVITADCLLRNRSGSSRNCEGVPAARWQWTGPTAKCPHGASAGEPPRRSRPGPPYGLKDARSFLELTRPLRRLHDPHLAVPLASQRRDGHVLSEPSPLLRQASLWAAGRVTWDSSETSGPPWVPRGAALRGSC
jgi:hypothetical protein